MKIDPNSRIEAHIGSRIKSYREATGLTQRECAKFLGFTFTHLNNVEVGKSSITIKKFGEIASSFGVTYYQMGNPHFRIPSLKKMPQALQDYLIQVKQDRKDRKSQPRIKLSPYLDNLLASKFLKTARTAAEIAAAIEKADGIVAEPGKITALLTKHPRNKIVRTIPGEEWGGGVNKYVLI